MKKPLRLGLTIALLGILSWGLVRWLAPSPAYYQGKSLKAWSFQLADETNPAGQREAEAAMRSLGPKALPGLIRLLRAHDPWVRCCVWRLAARLPAAWQPMLQSRAGPLNASLAREAAARSLGAMGAPAKPALPALHEAFLDPEGRVCWLAAEAAARVGGMAILPQLRDDLRGPSPVLRQVAAYTVGRMGPGASEAMPELAQALDNPRARSMAVYALCRMGVAAETVAAQVCTRGGDGARAGAARVLGGVLQAAVRAEAEPIASPAPADAARPARIDSAVRTLIAALRDPVLEVRVEAAQALSFAGQGGTSAIPTLAECLSTPSPLLRQMAAAALASQRGAARVATPELVRLVSDPDPSVRQAAKDALARIQSQP